MTKSKRSWDLLYIATADRLRSLSRWFPFPALISFILVTLLTAYVTLTTARRLGHPAALLTFPSDRDHIGGIWFSVTPIGEEIFIATSDRKVFHWPQNTRDLVPLDQFIEWLKDASHLQIEAAALLKRSDSNQVLAVIAADQTLKYTHLRPIIYALAKAGISRYAFETIDPTIGPQAYRNVTSDPTR